MTSEGVTVMLDVRLDPSDAVRAKIENALKGRPGVRSTDFSPYVRRVMKVQYDNSAINASEIGRVVHEVLGAQGPNTYIFGM
ncbi:MAG: hypothetical protein JSW09_08530 [Pseudomonadota bacterium]|nr:MAG: hypothetical protein JSW09_08530 [Pseudomonadota bacterium]